MNKVIWISVSLVLVIILGFGIFYILQSSNTNEEVTKCNQNANVITKNDCLTNLAIEENNPNICDKLSDTDKKICIYQYALKNRGAGANEISLNDAAKKELENCYQTEHCSGFAYYVIAEKYNLDSKICLNITDDKVKAECMIYTAGYSEEELKQILLKDELKLDFNARLHGLNSITGFSCQNLDFLIQMLTDKYATMRFKVIQKIGENNCSLVKSALNQDDVINGIKEAYYQEKDKLNQAQIIHTLGLVGNEKAIPFIKELLENSSTSDFIKISCLTALGYMGGNDSLLILNNYKDSDNELLRINARTYINQITKCAEKDKSTCLSI